MNPDRTPKTRSVWPTLRVKIARRKSGRQYKHFSSQLTPTAHEMFVEIWCSRGFWDAQTHTRTDKHGTSGTKDLKDTSSLVIRHHCVTLRGEKRSSIRCNFCEIQWFCIILLADLDAHAFCLEMGSTTFIVHYLASVHFLHSLCCVLSVQGLVW